MNTSFERKDNKEDWLTPPDLINSLGVFDLDPCSPIKRPWDTAIHHYDINDDGLKKDWFGRVWCNPPYSNKAELFIRKLKKHGNGIALIFARTETKNWFNNIWNDADAILFIKGRLKFYDLQGRQAQSAGAPSALIAYGHNNVKALESMSSLGKIIYLK